MTKLTGRTRIALGLIADQRHYSTANNLREICRLVDEAGRMGCDLFATEEIALSLFCSKTGAVRVPGAETRRLGAIARKHKMYVTLGLISKMGGKRRNSQVIFDRAGRIAGVYHKMQLTDGELRKGLTPGDEMSVFDTDFGRIAFVICYDTQFAEVVRMAGVKKADLIIFPHVGGAVGGDLVGRTVAYGNTCWTATVGRYFSGLCDPRGSTVATMRDAGKLLVVDADLRRTIMPINPAQEIVAWRNYQFLERRPETYSDLLLPTVAIESPQWPLYTGNELPAGDGELKFDIVNRSAKRQRGSVVAQFPAPLHIRSDEHVPWHVDRWVGAGDWRPSPRRFAFNLGAGERRKCLARFSVPEKADSLETVRISGSTADEDEVFWERQLVRFPEAPKLRVPRVARASDVATKGATIPLDKQFMGGAAGSRTELRVAHDGRSLIIHAVCRRYGPWHDEAKPSLEALSIPIMPMPGKDVLFWCGVARSGETTTQRREGGHPVRGARPRWSAAVRRSAQDWTALLKLPFAEFEGGRAPKRRRWRFNIQRSAALPDAVNHARHMSHVVSPSDAARKAESLGVEWAVWNPPYARIDCIARLGALVFDD